MNFSNITCSPRPERGGDFAPAVMLEACLRHDGGGSGAKRACGARKRNAGDWARTGSYAKRSSPSRRVPGLTRDLMFNEAPAQGRGGDVL